MNTLKTIGLSVLFTILINACTTDNTVEEHLNSKKINIIGTGEEGTTPTETAKS